MTAIDVQVVDGVGILTLDAPHRRNAFDLDTIRKVADTARAANPDIIIFVDNCYGEFTQKEEPCQAGADLVVGSLIKNPGGGIALLKATKALEGLKGDNPDQTAGTVPEGVEVVPTDSARALTAYLVSLRAESPLFESPFTPPAPPAPATNSPAK